jgi:hypothetical protein
MNFGCGGRRRGWVGAIAASAWILTMMISAAPAPALAGPLITDGTFQATSLASPGGYLCANGSGVGSTCTSNLTDWSATCSSSSCAGSSTPGSLLFAGTGADLDVGAWNGGRGLYPTILNAPGGGNAVAIDGGQQYRSSIYQTVAGLQVGDRYALTFYQAAGQQSGLSGATTEQWQVSLGGSTQYSTLMNNASEGVVGWNEQTIDFIATSSSEVLTFLALGTPAGEPPVVLLADVAMSDIPEPGTVAVLASGMIAGLLVLRRRRAV